MPVRRRRYRMRALAVAVLTEMSAANQPTSDLAQLASCKDRLTWIDNASGKSPCTIVAQSYSTPQWTYVNILKRGRSNIAAAEDVAGQKKGWSAMQIALPIIICIAVALLAGIAFFFYRRHVKRRYAPIADPYPARPNHMYQNSSSYSHQSIPHSRPGHQQFASSSSLGLQSIIGHNNPAPKRKKSAAAVAWERARMHAPRKLGGLLPDRPKVHERTRGADWSIDVDPEDLENGYNDPWHSKQGSTSSSGARSGGLHSKEASGESMRLKEPIVSHSSRSRHERSESQLGLLPDTSPEMLHPIQDAPDLIRERPTTHVVRQIFSGLNGVGMALGIRPRPVAVVSTSPRRGFNVDDVDSTGSPIGPVDPRESRHKSFVFAKHEIDTGSESPVIQTSPNPAIIEGSSSGGNPRQSTSNGSRTQNDASGDNSASRSASRERGRRDSVVLISRSPGQDFNSMASPITTEWLGPFSTSTESENWPAALTDSSSVLLPSFARQQQVALPLPPAPLPTSQTNSGTNSPSHSAPGMPLPPSRILIPQGNESSQLLVPPAIRAAGGYTNPTQQSRPSATLAPDPRISTTSLASSVVLPNTRLFSESVVVDPPSAVSNGALDSEHSSTHAYTVPNPFTFDGRHGGSAGAANALRVASPPRSRPTAEIIE